MSFPLGWEERKTMKDSKFSDAQKAFILRALLPVQSRAALPPTPALPTASGGREKTWRSPRLPISP
nr:hypothetical protein BOSE7B_41179 [Bosea sp. 7B]